jgi:hypothetical protein
MHRFTKTHHHPPFLLPSIISPLMHTQGQIMITWVLCVLRLAIQLLPRYVSSTQRLYNNIDTKAFVSVS